MSLKRIVLRDFVIVSELELDLSTGFTVLTGETGAGKSILIDALQLVTGGRADVGVIREGTQRADVSAEFDATPALATWLDAAGFDADDSLLLRRTNKEALGLVERMAEIIGDRDGWSGLAGIWRLDLKNNFAAKRIAELNPNGTVPAAPIAPSTVGFPPAVTAGVWESSGIIQHSFANKYLCGGRSRFCER